MEDDDQKSPVFVMMMQDETRPSTRRLGRRSWALLLGTAVGLIVYLSYSRYRHVQLLQEQKGSVRIAFVGNSVTFVNDLPRFMEALSDETIAQDSCLHGSLSLLSILTKGNGMYNKWQTDQALLDILHVEQEQEAQAEQNDDNANDDASNEELDYDDDSPNLYDDDYIEAKLNVSSWNEHPIYDFGACSVPQLLFGYDQALMKNDGGDDDNSYYYIQDGKNPCFQDAVYLDYLNEKYANVTKLLSEESKENDDSTRPRWDFVVMNDQTKYPALYTKRRKSLLSIKTVYSSIFVDLGRQTRPVFVATHGYDIEAATNSSSYGRFDAQLGNVSTFTSLVHYGVTQYAQTLAEYLPDEQAPLVAPVGLAFLIVYEEAKEGLWQQLFFTGDRFHPSPHGTYLMGCVLYATLFGRMPSTDVAMPSNGVSELWSRARRMEVTARKGTPVMPLPTRDEAAYLFSVAKRVVLEGEVPETLLDTETVDAMADYSV